MNYLSDGKVKGRKIRARRLRLSSDGPFEAYIAEQGSG